jgi:DNA-binding NarL/FixJ family response regulator
LLKRILIADDHESVLRRVREMIESHPDWQVCGEAVDGREAITKAQELKPDLVILDFAMPRLHGLRASLEIKKLLPDVPVVLFTMYGPEVAHHADEYGVTRLVDKSQSASLVATVEELFRTRIQQAIEQSPQLPAQAPLPVPDATPRQSGVRPRSARREIAEDVRS